MSTIIDSITEKPVTFYFCVSVFSISFGMMLFGINSANYIFITQLLFAGEWWRFFIAPFVCPNGFHIIASCVSIVYFGVSLEKRINSTNYFKALAIAYSLTVAISIALSFLTFLPFPLQPIIIGPGHLIVFILVISTNADNSPGGYAALYPLAGIIIDACFTGILTPQLIGFLLGYIFPDLFPNIIPIPNKKNNPNRGFFGKPHKIGN